jgi:hypothetical protein
VDVAVDVDHARTNRRARRRFEEELAQRRAVTARRQWREERDAAWGGRCA